MVNAANTTTSDRSLAIGVLLTSFCILVCELVLTRIYSVVLGYHFAFLAISIALFGLGLSGIVVYLKPDWFPASRLRFQLSRAATLLGVGIYLVVFLLLNLPLNLGSLSWLALVYLLSALPFFFGGLCLSLVFTHRAQIISRLYYFDLLGAAIGCLFTIWLLNRLGGPNALFVVGLLACLAGLIFGAPHQTPEPERRVLLRRLGQLGILAATVSILGLAISPFVRSFALRLGRRMYDEISTGYAFPNSFDWYVDQYVGDEIDSIVGSLQIFLSASLLIGLIGLVQARRGSSRPVSARVHLLTPAGIALLMISMLGVQFTRDMVKVRFARGHPEPPSLFERWNSISRIKVFPQQGWGRSEILAWGLSKNYPGPDVEHLHMNIDSEAGMPLLRFDGDLESWAAQHLKYDVSSMGYYLTNQPRSLIIGPGGGRDILTSLVFDSREIVGVELNPIILDVVNREFGDYTGRLYEWPQVRFVLDEGRSYLRRSDATFDIIQISLIDTWASVARGALAISENTLYTQEAFDDYVAKLSQDGVLSVTRWWHDPPLMLWRLVWMTANSLSAVGEDPARNILVIRGPLRGERQGRVFNMIASRSALTDEQIARILSKSEELGFDVAYAPGHDGIEKVTRFVRATSKEREAFADGLDAEIRPPTDDRPFFFSLTRARDFFTLEARPLASRIMARLLYLIIVVVFVFMWGPLLLLKRRELATIRDGATSWVVYFGCLGMGFIIVEMVLIQQFILFLGHPIYAVTLVIFGILLSSSLGSLTSGRLAEARLPQGLVAILAGIVVLLCIALIALPVISNAFFDRTLPIRTLVALAIVVPLGFLMGMPFPTGIRSLAANSAGVVPWMWGLNGAASVLGTVVAACFSIYFGFKLTYAFGASFYVIALGTAILRYASRARISARSPAPAGPASG